MALILIRLLADVQHAAPTKRRDVPRFEPGDFSLSGVDLQADLRSPHWEDYSIGEKSTETHDGWYAV